VIDEATLKAQLSRTLESTEGLGLEALGTHSHGKVRESYAKDGVRTLVVTDRISAFDVVLGTIPWKGQVLNQLAAHWLQLAGKHGIRTHYLDSPDPNVTRAIECRPLPVEFVMRAYLTGVTSTSIWRHYEEGKRSFAGHALPDGMRKNQKLERALLTPSTKAEHGGHDETVSREELLARGVLDARTFDEAAEMCEALFTFGQVEAARRGLILVDTKYEIGRAPDGGLVFIDEVHTPDSSRYWLAEEDRAANARWGGAREASPSEGGRERPPVMDPRSLDKEYVRRWLADGGYRGDGPPPALSDEVRMEAARRYIAAYELVTGTAFVADPTAPGQRLARGHASWPPFKKEPR
jgi:phosphoribosylaminoimidazole-succinocarboxamide synthase